MASIDRELCSRSLRKFVEKAWHTVEPARGFKPNWHHDAICEHLEAVAKGQISHLLLLIPPGQLKSLTVSVFWPAWMWGPANQPWRRFIYTSYGKHLSTRDSLKCRRVIRSPWYQACWGDKFNMDEGDQDAKTLYHNNHLGFRLATSVDGVSTGERGDMVIADDPHKVTEVESDTQRWNVIRWWDEAMSSRVNDPEDSAFVMMMQRTHSYDLAGHVLDKEGEDYVTLMLPMEFEPDRRCYTEVRPKSFKGPKQKKYSWDPRKKEGELLHSEFYSARAVAKLKKKLGSYASNAQLQMRPGPRAGGLVKLTWFQRYGTPPTKRRIRRVVQSWDTATREAKEAQTGIAYSVCTTWLETIDGSFLSHVYRERLNIPDLERMIISLRMAHRANVVLIEDASSGTALVQYVKKKKRLRGMVFSVFGIKPEKDKVARMDIETPAIEAGEIWLPEEAPWLPDYESEIRDFPATNFKDQVDSTSQYLKWRREKGSRKMDMNLH